MNPEWTVLTTLTIVVFVIGWLWFGPLASLRRDEFRSDIRRIRDELFDYMWRNGHGFDSASYRCVRQTLNGLLRLSNRLNPLWFVSILLRPNIVGMHELTLDEGDPELKRELYMALTKAAIRSYKFAFWEGTWGVIFRLLRAFRRRDEPKPQSDSITPRDDVFLRMAYAIEMAAY